jgi:predicted RNA-binding Zn-ribbon protein involved in translation (DUF1610 family)
MSAYDDQSITEHRMDSYEEESAVVFLCPNCGTECRILHDVKETNKECPGCGVRLLIRIYTPDDAHIGARGTRGAG